MAVLGVLNTIAGGRTQYEAITASGQYTVTLDNTANYLFTISTLGNVGVSIVSYLLTDGLKETETTSRGGVYYYLIFKKDIVEFNVSNATVDKPVKIESFIA